MLSTSNTESQNNPAPTCLEVNPIQRYSIRDVLLTRHAATDTICITAYKEVDGETKATDHFSAGVDEAASLIERGYEREDVKAIWSNLQRLKPGSVKRKKGETIDRYTNLLIDIDRRVKSVHRDGSLCPHNKSEQKECGGYRCNATESERKVLFDMATKVADFLRPLGDGAFADSGNGYHLSWRLGNPLHGDQANALVLYWNKQHKREAKAKQWFMAAMALGCLLEAMLYAYFIIWSGNDGNDAAKDEQIPDSLVLNDLLDGAKQIDLLTPVKFKDKFGDHAVQDVVHEIRHLRNNIHAGVALRKTFDPARFKKKDYTRLKKIFDAIWDNFELAL